MSNILSYGEYARIETGEFQRPYIVEAGSGNHKVLFYGSEQVNDPKHPQFQDIENRWNTFIAQTNSPITLVEGRFDEVDTEDTQDRTKSIVDGGEAQFVVHLARRDNVPVVSPEPDRIREANELANEFSRDKVDGYVPRIRESQMYRTYASC